MFAGRSFGDTPEPVKGSHSSGRSSHSRCAKRSGARRMESSPAFSQRLQLVPEVDGAQPRQIADRASCSRRRSASPSSSPRWTSVGGTAPSKIQSMNGPDLTLSTSDSSRGHAAWRSDIRFALVGFARSSNARSAGNAIDPRSGSLASIASRSRVAMCGYSGHRLPGARARMWSERSVRGRSAATSARDHRDQRVRRRGLRSRGRAGSARSGTWSGRR